MPILTVEEALDCLRRSVRRRRKRRQRREEPRGVLGRPVVSTKGCRRCEGMPWRRPMEARCACGKLWQAEVFSMPLPSGGQWWWSR